MCGIIGYKGNKQAFPIILNGLKHLEYRGYDSAGIVTFGSGIHVKKDSGKVGEIFSLEDSNLLKGNIGIGHTRWATHGGVSKENAHPHISNNGKIAVVHNGIIENYQELRNFLLSNNFTFHSETDTEVIPNLIEFHMKKYDINFFEATKEALKKLEGSYAIVTLHKDEEKLVAARKESPLVVGVGNNEYFIASDIPAFLEHTKNVLFLSENEIVLIDKSIEIFNLIDGSKIERKIDTVEWDIEQAKKGDFNHFMIKEIAEQADTIKRAINQDEKIIYEIADAIKNASGIFFVACGTAYHACLSASYILSTVAKLHVNVVLGSEFPNYKDFLRPETLVIAVSQSGETADVLNAIRTAKLKGSKVISIVNVMGSTLARESDKTLLQHAGPEISVLSTKSYTSQLAILTLIAYALADIYEEGRDKLKDLVNYIYHLTAASTRNYVRNLSESLKEKEHIYMIGRGLQYPTALEAALKIKEVSYIHAEGFAGGELKHGTIALIEKGTPCIVFTSKETEKEMLGNAMELKSRGAYIIGVGHNNNEIFDFFIKVREAEEANSICQIIPIQILAYQLAVLRGCDPDRPRNLAKSVTVK